MGGKSRGPKCAPDCCGWVRVERLVVERPQGFGALSRRSRDVVFDLVRYLTLLETRADPPAVSAPEGPDRAETRFKQYMPEGTRD